MTVGAVRRLDPNYLLASQFRLSPWHRALHRWATTVGGGGPGSGAGAWDVPQQTVFNAVGLCRRGATRNTLTLYFTYTEESLTIKQGIPLLHVDLHGKVSEKLHLDLGAAPLEEATKFARHLGMEGLLEH